jgi:uncharacterized protein
LELYSIPYQDGYIVYRPLLQLAFVANAAMVNLLARLDGPPFAPASDAERQALSFLEEIGFFEPDPEPPPAPSAESPYQPTVAVLCLTTACNFRCVYCYARGGETEVRHLPVELGRRAIDLVSRNALDRGEDRFSLAFHGGGEPTLAGRQLRALVRDARSREVACQVSLTTNGYWTANQRAWLLDNIDQVSLSLDGLPEVQDRQRPTTGGRPSFARVLASAQAMDRRKVSYGIRLTVTDDSIGGLRAGLDLLCRETRCGVFQVEPAFAYGRALDRHGALSRIQRFGEAFLEAWEIGAVHDRHVYYSGARPWLATRRFCQALDQALVVTPDGALTACYEVCGPEHPLAGGFFFGTMGQVDLTARQRIHERIEQRRARCSGCFCFWHCAGDCPSKTLAPDGGERPDAKERCELNRFITKELLIRYMDAGGGLWRGYEAPRKEVAAC